MAGIIGTGHVVIAEDVGGSEHTAAGSTGCIGWITGIDGTGHIVFTEVVVCVVGAPTKWEAEVLCALKSVIAVGMLGLEFTVGDGVTHIRGTAHAVIALSGGSCIATPHSCCTFVDRTTDAIGACGIVCEVLAVELEVADIVGTRDAIVAVSI